MSESGLADGGRLGIRDLLDLGAGMVMSVGHRALARRVIELAQLTAEDRGVDVGCGPGNSARLAATRGAHVIGVDPSPGMLRVARWLTGRRFDGRLTLRLGTAEALPIETGTATVAWATASFHHWSDRLAGLKEIRRILAPGGRLMLVERVLDDAGKHEHGLQPSELEGTKALLDRAQFTSVSSETVPIGRRHFFVIRGTADGTANPAT